MRRRLECLCAAVLLWLCGICVPPGLAVTVSGRVLRDADGDGQAGTTDPGVPGVLVSDGVTVTATDAQGRYGLESPQARLLLAVTTPRDHVLPGRFWRWADGTAPEDFLLTPSPQPDSYFWVHITDCHVGRVDLLKQFVTRLNAFPVPLAFVVSTGDLVGGVDVVPVDKAKEQFDRYLDGVAQLRVPLLNLPGNHEHVAFQVKDADPADPRYGKGLHREMFGPMHYSWDWGPYHFLALDGTTLPYREELGDEQLAWLKADLAQTPVETPLVLLCHQSLPALRDAAALAATLQGRTVVAGFCGHLHETSLKALGTIPVHHTAALSGSWWGGPNPDGTPQGFALVKMAGAEALYCYTDREGSYSLYVSKPSAAAIVSGVLSFKVTVLDYARPVSVTAQLHGLAVPMSRATRGEFWSVWSGSVDTTQVPDGVVSLEAAAALDDSRSNTLASYLVLNGNEPPYAASGDAVVKLQVRGVDAADEVWLNGERLGVIPAGTANETTVAFPAPARLLKRANKLTVRAVAALGATDKDDFNVGSVWMEYAGKRFHDIRYVVFARHQIGDGNPAAYGTEKDLYLCLP